MVTGKTSIREYLAAGNFRDLFVQELGWDHFREPLRIEISTETYLLSGQAKKRDMGVFLCEPDSDGRVPDATQRRKIEKQVTKSVHEHIIIYVDAARLTQVWQWVKREIDKPDRPREYTFHVSQSGEPLIQRLHKITFTLNEEAELHAFDPPRRVRDAFDVDKVTKRFYDRFKTEHDRFLNFIQGVPEQGDREWYASLMLNRLMFVYFIQKKGFLDGDLDYLQNRLRMVQRRQGQDHFLSFYRYFLLRLFHEGLGQSQRSPELGSLLGTVPYLNGGLFDVHQLEAQYGGIEIADDAFERIFAFFDQYEWHLDTRPLRKDNEINPDVLGYIFEKYINQKQMGAYYTKEDITGYISKNTVIPFLFDEARKRCAIAFEPSGSVWSLLRDNPDRYIYEPVRKGVDLELPGNIAAGVHDVSKRQDWNRSASTEYALPTETWREHVARRKRCDEIRNKLASGQVTEINDLVTYNLDIVQFAQDVIFYCEGPELLRAFYRAIERVTILDPTCGSGAFLFAALNILDPLYDACLDRMQAFVDDLDRSEQSHSPRKFQDFRETLADVARHPNREYFILKSIILNNLYGVDIMEEAVEIAKLRLFLKLVAHIEGAEDMEPLPDIDFNIRVGNTLVGFATYDEARRSIDGVTDDLGAVQNRMDFGGIAERIRERAQDVERLFEHFRQQQTEYGGDVTFDDKQDLLRRLAQLDHELDRYLASEYGVARDDQDAFDRWRISHRPFHWFVEFYGIMGSGGFEVVIGNPPYIEYSQVKSHYRLLPSEYSTISCGNLYAPILDRCFSLTPVGSRTGMIVQLSAICTDRMEPLQRRYVSASSVIWASCFDDRPGKLFDGLEHIRAAILLSVRGGARSPDIYTTRLLRWYSHGRAALFECITYVDVAALAIPGSFPKVGEQELLAILSKVRRVSGTTAAACMPRSAHMIHYYRSPLYWIRAMDFLPFFSSARQQRSIHHFKDLGVADSGLVAVVGSLINSTLFYLWFIVYGNGRNVALRDIETMPMPPTLLQKPGEHDLAPLFDELMEDYRQNSVIRERKDGVKYQEFYPSKSKSIMDRMDRFLAHYCGLTREETDFIINYDIKYRMGQDGEG